MAGGPGKPRGQHSERPKNACSVPVVRCLALEKKKKKKRGSDHDTLSCSGQFLGDSTIAGDLWGLQDLEIYKGTACDTEDTEVQSSPTPPVPCPCFLSGFGNQGQAADGVYSHVGGAGVPAWPLLLSEQKYDKRSGVPGIFLLREVRTMTLPRVKWRGHMLNASCSEVMALSKALGQGQWLQCSSLYLVTKHRATAGPWAWPIREDLSLPSTTWDLSCCQIHHSTQTWP